MDIPSDKELTEYIFKEDEAVKADLIMMFGTRIKIGINLVHDLWLKQYAPVILISGGRNKRTDEIEADVISQTLIDRGVPTDIIIKESKSTNTKENVTYSVRLLDDMGLFNQIKLVLLVVKNYHARRCLMTCRRWFPAHVKFRAISYASYSFDRTSWPSHPEGRARVEGEYIKIQKYLAQGDLLDLD